MYEVDFIGGPLDGKAYAFPDVPPFIYVPTVVGSDERMGIFEYLDRATSKLVYKHVLNGLYIYQGVE